MVLWIFVLGFALPKLIVYQMMVKLENATLKLESMSNKARKKVIKKISKKPTKKLEKEVESFMEFFAISPVDIDPYGIMKKFEFLVDQQKQRFKYFVNQIAPDLDEEERADIMMGLSGSMSLYQITKIVRHFLELTRKTKSQYYAMILQMQLPLIERIAKSLMKGTEAFVNGWMIGDTIGPFVVADFIGDSKVKEGDEDTVYTKKKYKDRDIIAIKAKGPGGRTGNPGRLLEKIAKKEKIAKIITIDAAAKLEGEETGTIAEGVGVAMGGIGVEKDYIENVAVKNKIPFDSIIVKMSQEEAIMPIKKPILESKSKILEILDKTIERTDKKGKIVLIGVGNTSGVGNDKKAAEKAEKEMKKVLKRLEKKRKESKKKFKWPFSISLPMLNFKWS
jgi:hypothetical protein